jgi:hypothetical protein
MNRIFLTFATALFIVVFASCNKNEEKPVTTQAEVEAEMKHELFAETLFDEVFDIGNEGRRLMAGGMKDGQNLRRLIGDCATVTIDTTVMPRVLTIDFGAENCLCPDGKYRRGKIIITFNGRFYQPGTLITTTFDGFHVNDNHIQGVKTRENLGLNSDGFPHFSSSVDGSVTLASDGTVITRQAQHLRTWIEGFGTPQWFDDVFLIEGNASTTVSTGQASSRTIINPLRKELSCHHFVSGTVEIERTGRPQAILDFGDGECDNIATVTIDGQTFTIRLP